MAPADSLPTIYVPERVLEVIFRDVLDHPQVETGHGLIGVESTDFIVIVGVIPATEETKRSYASLFLGGDTQLAILEWYQQHWLQMRKSSYELGIPNWDTSTALSKGTIPQELSIPLSVVGDWHKHPGDYNLLSQTDFNQINQILSDPLGNQARLITPIATYQPGHTVLHRFNGYQVVLQQVGEEIRLDWYYSHRDSELTYKITPVILSDSVVPELPPIPWYLYDVPRMREELQLLKDAHYEVTWEIRQFHMSPFQAVCFTINHPNWHKTLLLVTEWDYPFTPAKVFTVAKKPTRSTRSWLDDVHDRIYQPKKRLIRRVMDALLPTTFFKKESYLVDLVHAVLPNVEVDNHVG